MIRMFGLISIITYNQVYAARRKCPSSGVTSSAWVNPSANQQSPPHTGSSFFTTTPSFSTPSFTQFSPLTPHSPGSSLFSTITPSPTFSQISTPPFSAASFYSFGSQPSVSWSVPTGIPTHSSIFTGTHSQPHQLFTFSPPGYAGQSPAAGTPQFVSQQFSTNPPISQPTTTGSPKVISSILELLGVTFENMINALKAGNLHIDNFKLHCYALKIRAIKRLSTYEKLNEKQIAKQGEVNNMEIIGEVCQMVEILKCVGNIFVCERERQLNLINIERLVSNITAYQERTKRAQEVQGMFNGELALWEKEMNELQHYLKMLQQHICNVTHDALEKEKEEILKVIKPALNQLGFTFN